MNTFLTNKFSVDMLDTGVSNTLEISPGMVQELKSVGFQSIVDDEADAYAVSQALDMPVEANHENVKLDIDTTIWWARIKEGKLKLLKIRLL